MANRRFWSSVVVFRHMLVGSAAPFTLGGERRIAAIRLFCWVAAPVTVAMLHAGVNAEIVRFRMTGAVVVADTFNLLPNYIYTGAPFVAYVAWDNSVEDQNPDPLAGYYAHPPADPATAPYGMSVQIGQNLFRADTSAGYIITTAVGNGNPSYSDVVGSYTMPLLKSFDYRPTGHTIVDEISLALQDLSGTALISDALPAVLDSEKFGFTGVIDNSAIFTAGSFFQIDGASFVMVGDNTPPSYFVKAFIQEITVVPEPSCIQLLVAAGCISAVLGSIGLHRRKPFAQNGGIPCVRQPKVGIRY